MNHRPNRTRRSWRVVAVLFAAVAGSSPALAHSVGAAPAAPERAGPVVGTGASPRAAQAADVSWTWLDDRAKKLVYSAGWGQYDNLTVQQSRTATSTNTAGSTMTTTCTCSAFRFYSVKSPVLGTTEVRVDGQVVTTASATAATPATKSSIVWASPIMAYGAHTLTLTSITGWTEIDAIAVGNWSDPTCPGLSGNAATSTKPGTSPSLLHDGRTDPWAAGWISGRASATSVPAQPVCVQIDTGVVQPMHNVVLYPRTLQDSFDSTGFPLRYSVQIAQAADFSDAVEFQGISETAEQQAGYYHAVRAVQFDRDYQARYIRVIARELGVAESGVFSFALAEVRENSQYEFPYQGQGRYDCRPPTAYAGRPYFYEIPHDGHYVPLSAEDLPPGLSSHTDFAMHPGGGRLAFYTTVVEGTPTTPGRYTMTLIGRGLSQDIDATCDIVVEALP
jgi:hypothetical protein